MSLFLWNLIEPKLKLFQSSSQSMPPTCNFWSVSCVLFKENAKNSSKKAVSMGKTPVHKVSWCFLLLEWTEYSIFVSRPSKHLFSLSGWLFITSVFFNFYFDGDFRDPWLKKKKKKKEIAWSVTRQSAQLPGNSKFKAALAVLGYLRLGGALGGLRLTSTRQFA